MLSFTDFKISLGINSDDRNGEYASILKGLIRELYTIYGIAIDKDTKETNESIIITSLTFDTPIKLAYKNIVSLTIPTFNEGIDYTVDKNEGTLTVLSSGSMLEQSYDIFYSYYVFINESNSLILLKDPKEDELTYWIDVKPFKINSVSYGGTTLAQNTDYFVLGQKIVLATALTTLTTPLIIDLSIGYDEVPYDLKQAFYDMANYRMNKKLMNADIISRVEDSNGTSTSYRNDSIPKYLKDIFMGYMGRRLAFS